MVVFMCIPRCAQGKRSRLGQIINTLASGHIVPIGTRRNIFQNGGHRGGDRDANDDVSSQGSASSFAERKAEVQSPPYFAFCNPLFSGSGHALYQKIRS